MDGKVGRVARVVAALLAELGEDPEREGLRGTPERVERTLEFLTTGYSRKVEDFLNEAIVVQPHDEMVLVKGIEFFSTCEGHLLPFFGWAHVAYWPERKIVRISKMPWLVEMFSRRLQAQERLTQQIARALDEVLQPKGVAVVIEATHLCMRMRGVEKQSSRVVTSAMLGSFCQGSSVRFELMTLLGIRRP